MPLSAAKDHPATALYRVDRFIVPAHALDAFVAQMKRLQATLQALPGCLHATVLTQLGGPGRFNVLTWVEWKDQASVDQAAAAMQRQFAAEGFVPKAFLQQLGAEADLGLYRAVA